MLAQGQLSDTNSSLKSVGSSQTVYFKSLIFHNTDSSEQTIYIHFVPHDGSNNLGVADSTNIIINQILASGETFEFSPAFPISSSKENDAIFASASSANLVNYLITGFET